MPSPLTELLRQLAAVFAARGVRWYLFGGQAAILHGAARLTADVDVTLELGATPLSALLADLSAAGFATRVDEPLAFAERMRVGPVVHRASSMPVDLILAGPGLEQRFLERAEVFDLEGLRVPVASAEDVVVMKLLAGREKDRDDTAAILAARSKDLDLGYVRACLRSLEAALDRSDLVSALERLLGRPGL